MAEEALLIRISLFSKVENPKLRIALILHFVWPWLGCAVALAIYALHPSRPIGYWFAIVLILPVYVVIALALQARAKVNESRRRRYLLAVILYGAWFLTASVTLVWLALLFAGNFGLILCLLGMFLLSSAAPLLVPSVVLVLEGSSKLSGAQAVRTKLARPAVLRALSMLALYIVYLILNYASTRLFESYTLTGALAYAVELLPVLAFFGFIPIYKKYMAEEEDEFQRHRFRQSMLWALAGTFIIASAMGRLEEHRLIFHRHQVFFRILVFPLFWSALQIAPAVNGMVQGVQEMRGKRDQ